MKICPNCQTQNRDEARFCFRCGKAIDDQLTYQEPAQLAYPSPQQPIIQVIQTVEPKKKNKIGWVAGGCLLLLMVACVVIVLSMPKSETSRVTGPGAKVGEVTGTPQTPTPIKVETYKVGDIIAVETHTIVLNSVLVNGKTIKANFTIENKGTQDMAVSSVMSFYAKDSEGTNLDLEFDCGTDLGGKVLPGDKLKGDICWTGAVNFPVKIYYESGFFTSGAVVWEVTKP